MTHDMIPPSFMLRRPAETQREKRRKKLTVEIKSYQIFVGEFFIIKHEVINMIKQCLIFANILRWYSRLSSYFLRFEFIKKDDLRQVQEINIYNIENRKDEQMNFLKHITLTHALSFVPKNWHWKSKIINLEEEKAEKYLRVRKRQAKKIS